MTDALLIGNDQSPLINTLKNAGKLSDFYTYRLQYNGLSTGIQVVKTDPKIIPTATFYSKQVMFDIPKNGLWTESMIEVSIVNATASTSVNGTHLGARFFNRLDLIAHGSIIATIYPESLYMLCDTLPFEQATQLQYLLNGTAVSYTAAAESIIYIPLKLFCFDNTFNYLETRFIENLTLSGTINTQAGMGLAGALTSCSLKLISIYRIMTEPALKSYRSFMYPENKRVQMLINDYFTETPKTMSASGADVLLTCPNVSTRSYFYCSLIANNYGPTNAGRLTTISITINGVKICETIPVELLKLEDSKQGGSYIKVKQDNSIVKLSDGVTSGTIDKSGYVFNWGQFAGSAMNSFSGGISLLNVSNPTLNVIGDAVTNANTYQIQVVHSYLKVMSIDQTGKVTISSSL